MLSPSQGGTDADFAMSEMLIEEAEDIFKLLVKAQYAGDDDAKAAAWTDVLVVRTPNELEKVQKLLPEGQDFFAKIGPCAGDFALFSVLNIIMDLEPNILSRFPRLTKQYVSDQYTLYKLIFDYD